MKFVLFFYISLLVCSQGYQNIQQQRLFQPSFLQVRQTDTQTPLSEGNIEGDKQQPVSNIEGNEPQPAAVVESITQPQEQSPQTQPVDSQQSEQVAPTLPAPVIPPQEEKDLLLVVPFTKEQFEAEIKLQSQLLASQIVADHKSTMEQLKGISNESNRIIEQKGQMIGMYLNQTTTYLDNLSRILQRELEQNHSILVKLAESIVLSQNSNLEKEILNIKEQMKNILNKVQPPDSTCEKELKCGSCITRPDCVWSTDRRSCFVGSKFDGCFFDFCEFFTRDHCVSNSQADIEGVSMESYVFDEELAKTMEESYGNQDVELAIQRIPQPQKNFMLAQQNKLIDLKDEIQKLRMFSNYMKRIYYKLRFQNVMLKRKLQRQAEEDKKFLQDLEKANSDFLKSIKESEEEQEITVTELIKNEKAIEQARQEAMMVNNGTIEPPKMNKQGKVIQKTKVKEDGSLLDENGQVIEGIRVFEGKKIINEQSREARSDLRYENGYIIGEDGQVMSPQQVKQKLLAEETFVDGLLDFWYGPPPKEKKMDAADKLRIQKQRNPTAVDVDSAEIQDEEISILQHIADQLEAQELERKQTA